MVVDRLESHSAGRHFAYEPFGAAVIDLALGMAILDCVLDIGCVESALPNPIFSVLGPYKALDLHGLKPTAAKGGARSATSGLCFDDFGTIDPACEKA